MANEKRLIWYRFKTKAVKDYRPLVDMKHIGMPWWCTGIAGDNSYAIVAMDAPYDPEWFTRLAARQFEILKIIDDAPTVDAVDVVHGQWEIIPDDYFDLVELKCSVCGESWGFEDYEDCIPQNYHYCPNCGAKMDGGVKNA